jgi:hypothetical protein
VIVVISIAALSTDCMQYLINSIAVYHCQQAATTAMQGNNRTQELVLTGSAIIDVKQRHEVWIQGALYDVSKSWISGGVQHLIVYHDESEESVIEKIGSLIAATTMTVYDGATHQLTHEGSHRIIHPKTTPPVRYHQVFARQGINRNFETQYRVPMLLKGTLNTPDRPPQILLA